MNGARIQEATARLDLLLAKFNLEEAAADLERLTGGETPLASGTSGAATVATPANGTH